MRIFILLICLAPASFALAEYEKHEPAQINFNHMIEANHAESKSLQKELNHKGFGLRPKEEKSQKSMVVDFIDAEIGVGEAPQVVDRRFN